MVVTDLFTKWAEALPFCSTESTTLVTVLVDEIVCRYGVPTNIHSDQGANFTSSLIQHLCSLLGVGRTQTTAYHPQSNGQVERFSRTLEAMLAKVVQTNQRDWDIHLPKVLFAYHTAVCSCVLCIPIYSNSAYVTLYMSYEHAQCSVSVTCLIIACSFCDQ